MISTPDTGRRALSRLDFLRLGGTVGAAFLGSSLGFLGCASDRKRGPTRLTFSHGEDTATLRSQILRFNARNRGEIEVEFRLAPADTGQYFEALRTGFQSGESSVDIISGDVIWPAQFAAAGWLSDLSGHFGEGIRASHLPAAVDSNVYEGRVYGVPWFTDAGLLYYRKDLLEKSGFSGPPRTWEELGEQARKVVRDTATRYGYVFQGAEYEGGVVNGLEFVWNSGGGVLDRGLDGVTAGSKAIEGMRVARKMVDDGVSPQSVASYKEYESYSVFLAGGAVFMRNWPNIYARAADPSQSNVAQRNVGVAALPAADVGNPAYSGLGGWNLMVNAQSEDKLDEIWAFIRYLSAPEQQKERALEGGYLPTLRASYGDDEILAKVPVMALGEEAIRNARSRPVTPFYRDMSLAMAERFHASLSGAVTSEQAAATLQEDLEGILRRAEGL